MEPSTRERERERLVRLLKKHGVELKRLADGFDIIEYQPGQLESGLLRAVRDFLSDEEASRGGE